MRILCCAALLFVIFTDKSKKAANISIFKEIEWENDKSKKTANISIFKEIEWEK
ncbi:hypothetical protein T4A_11672 [Trichinella pseudospiralis]|uniref:Uncharacterized protein n=1 Tax=Trichinella pseudospiralis TaxID=6337 RepID=A0A0V1DDU9_TRIPS|nr:hypothetical protein T4A_11672 [Trichinella pseudospiralis]